jgi:hypothetical protein
VTLGRIGNRFSSLSLIGLTATDEKDEGILSFKERKNTLKRAFSVNLKYEKWQVSHFISLIKNL